MDKSGRTPTPIELAEAAERDRLLELRMPFGEFKGAHIISIPPDRALWLLTEWTGRDKLFPELKRALELRVQIKRDEMTKAQREANA